VIPKIFHQTTADGQLSWEEKRLLARYRRLSPDWLHRLWNDYDNSAMVQRYFPQYAARYEAIRFGVAKADIARYVYMHAYGGFYLDTDYKVFRPFDDDLLSHACVIPREFPQPIGAENNIQHVALGNAVFGSEPNHPFWARLIGHIFDMNKPEDLRDRHGIVRKTGPNAVSDFFIDHAGEFTDIFMPDSALFYPSFVWYTGKTAVTQDTYGVHLNWGSWHNRSPRVAAKVFVRRKLNGYLA
jgi:mannosyltransferase OCH1-like enzyme